jgi:hypothetical protein
MATCFIYLLGLEVPSGYLFRFQIQRRKTRSSIKSKGVGLLIVVLLAQLPLFAGTIPVRFAEGVVNGFLVLRDGSGTVIASGDLLQVNKGGTVDSRTVFYFKDESLSDETVVYTQERVFSLQSYRLVQRGPAFKQDLEVALERSGKYVVKSRDRKDGEENVSSGTLDLPPDVYNGMAITVAKNLPEGARETVHHVAFTPKPQLIELEFIPGSLEKVLVGEVNKDAVHYVIKPHLGTWLKVMATLFGRVPPDYHSWIIKKEVPAFLRADGPFYMGGPIWRIELTAPRWPD